MNKSQSDPDALPTVLFVLLPDAKKATSIISLSIYSNCYVATAKLVMSIHIHFAKWPLLIKVVKLLAGSSQLSCHEKKKRKRGERIKMQFISNERFTFWLQSFKVKLRGLPIRWP